MVKGSGTGRGELRAAGIALDAPLGQYRTVLRDGERFPLGGGTESLGIRNKIDPVWDAAAGSCTDVSAGSSCIQAVGWTGSRCPVARTWLTYSQSSKPNSPHYSDRTELYSGERWVTSRFCAKDTLRSPALRVVRVHERRWFREARSVLARPWGGEGPIASGTIWAVPKPGWSCPEEMRFAHAPRARARVASRVARMHGASSSPKAAQ
ncbi:penicillin acylase family protein [Streptomyces atratus]|uniref:penicillin acylase family protein n=1 Tax=Streptomyces atratus TaxID=1893 RepID=UPI002AC34F19|nr:penicillin acylase family protein [Streptomyces atratus]WPW33338.1 penicillin acylase family protein [Streptomyces atratus]